MPRYSVIIPVYNVELYLEEYIESVLAQDSPSEYEVILVDDGSTDGSGAICDRYVERYPNIQVLHQENQGLSMARNVGLQRAVGEFILFLDSDDLWMPDLLRSLDQFTVKKPDITLFPYEKFDQEGHSKIIYPPLFPEGESGEEYLSRVFSIGKMPPVSAWGCMFYHAFLEKNKLQFQPGLIYEDLDFSLYSYPAARSVMAVNHPLYRYRIRAGSITQQQSPRQWLMAIDIMERWIRRYPTSGTANYYCSHGLSIPDFGTKRDTQKYVNRYAENANVLKYVSNSKLKILRFLYRVFGYYNGAQVYMMLVRTKHIVYKPKI